MMKFVFALCLALAVADATNVQRCVHHSGNLPQSTRIEGCTNPPCVLQQLRNAVIHMTFRAPRNMQSMRTLATAYLGAVPVPYNLGNNANTCNFLTNTRCPVSSGTSVNYTLRMYIESWFPVGTSATIEFRIVDDRNQPVVCVRVPIRISRSGKFIEGENELPRGIEAQ
ncbi:NPC intracellular cholesterol transporter 2 [Papilio machaon]|uniref:NPC intracellular cholesterol transporter 2 n=1 Tax=Papilio machaon TaxID=76193 RepID=UPI001E664CA3|nr:NPC intracellular cholesterol transporter 2 [Papilio machaon]